MKVAILTSICLFLNLISFSQNDNENIYLKNLSDTQIAIIDDSEKTLFIETVSDDKQIIGIGKDFYTIYFTESRKLFIKNKWGKIISGIKVPIDNYVEAIDFSNMDQYEIFNALDSKIAFTIENLDTGKKTKYNKFCKVIGH
jgi:hypothetical protein